jgi:hypothetical protein
MKTEFSLKKKIKQFELLAVLKQKNNDNQHV